MVPIPFFVANCNSISSLKFRNKFSYVFYVQCVMYIVYVCINLRQNMDLGWNSELTHFDGFVYLKK